MALHGYAGKILHLDMYGRKANAGAHREVPAVGRRARPRLGAVLGLLQGQDDQGRPQPGQRRAASARRRCPARSRRRPAGAARWSGVGVGQHPQSWYHPLRLRRPLLDDAQVRRLGCHRHHRARRTSRRGSRWCNDKVTFHDAAELWGKDTWATQHDDLGADRARPREDGPGGWTRRCEGRSATSRLTTQTPAVLCIGPAGENQTAYGCLIHDAGNGAGQGGFGAVWGSKNLKAISVIGTGSISVADPAGAAEGPLRAEGEVRHVSWEQPDFGQWSHLGGLPNAARRMTPPPTDERRPQALPGLHQRLPGALQRGLRQRVHLPGDRLVHLGGQPRGEEPGATRRSEHEGGRHHPAVRDELVRVPDRPALARAAPRRGRHRRRARRSRRACRGRSSARSSSPRR